MPRLRDVVTVVATGIALTVLGSGTAAATPAGCPPPPPDMEHGCCAGGFDGLLNLDGLLGGLFGGGCCPATED